MYLVVELRLGKEAMEMPCKLGSESGADAVAGNRVRGPVGVPLVIDHSGAHRGFLGRGEVDAQGRHGGGRRPDGGESARRRDTVVRRRGH